MLDLNDTNSLILIGVVVLALLVTWWLLRRATTKPERRERRPDVLDEGQAPAQRNQALIDAPPAAQIITPLPGSATLGGIGEAIAVGAQDVVEEVEARAPVIEPEPTPVVVEAPAPKPEPAPVAPVTPPVEPAPPVEVAPEPEPEPAPAPESVPQPEPVQSASDDLSRIKGLGPKLQALLPQLGVTTFAQIAAWTEADLARIDPQLGSFAGRPARDNWIEQARFLAQGDVAGFEERFGKV